MATGNGQLTEQKIEVSGTEKVQMEDTQERILDADGHSQSQTHTT